MLICLSYAILACAQPFPPVPSLETFNWLTRQPEMEITMQYRSRTNFLYVSANESMSQEKKFESLAFVASNYFDKYTRYW